MSDVHIALEKVSGQPTNLPMPPVKLVTYGQPFSSSPAPNYDTSDFDEAAAKARAELDLMRAAVNGYCDDSPRPYHPPVYPKQALIAVDVQVDFIVGPMVGSNRESVVGPLLELSKYADFTIASADSHPADHCSFVDQGGPWPPHCVKGTMGSSVVGSIVRAARGCVILKGQDADKEAYSAFDGVQPGTGLSLDDILQTANVKSLVIGGLCTDYCVRATALDARERGYPVTIYADSIAGVAPAAVHVATGEMIDAGVKFDWTDLTRPMFRRDVTDYLRGN